MGWFEALRPSDERDEDPGQSDPAPSETPGEPGQPPAETRGNLTHNNGVTFHT